jgi:hypothetical protein
MRLDHKATAISLLVVLGVRMVKRCCSRAVKAMGGESSDDWRSVLDSDRPGAAPTFSIADPPPDDACQRLHSRCKPRRQRPATVVPLHDKHVFDTHVLAARQNGP